MGLQTPHRTPGQPIPPRASRPASGHRFDAPELQALRAADEARDRDFDRFSQAALRRWKLYVLGAVLCFPVYTWFFTSAGFQSLWFQVLVSAALGTFFAFQRPTGSPAVAATVGAGLIIQAWTGHIMPSFGLLMTVIFYGLLGGALGVAERGKLIDGR